MPRSCQQKLILKFCFRRLWYNRHNRVIVWSLAGANVEHAYLESNRGVLVLLTALIGNGKKEQYLKIFSLKFDELWRKSFPYRTSVNDSQPSFSWTLLSKRKIQKPFAIFKYLKLLIVNSVLWGNLEEGPLEITGGGGVKIFCAWIFILIPLVCRIFFWGTSFARYFCPIHFFFCNQSTISKSRIYGLPLSLRSWRYCVDAI